LKLDIASGTRDRRTFRISRREYEVLRLSVEILSSLTKVMAPHSTRLTTENLWHKTRQKPP
jgi:AMMECR1 domain-containing protein